MIRASLFPLAVMVIGPPAAAQVSDLPSGHWAQTAVKQVVALGIMHAPGGKFKGSARITRRELAQTLASYAKVLEKGWPSTSIHPVGGAYRDRKLANVGPVTRYEVATVLVRGAAYAVQGIPKVRGKVFAASEAFPPPPKVSLPSTDPSYEALKYLASRRMLPGNSPLMKPGNQSVMPAELTAAVAWVFIGLNDRYTDEPQNREDIAPPPNHHHKP